MCYLGRGVPLICVFDAWCGELWFGVVLLCVKLVFAILLV